MRPHPKALVAAVLLLASAHPAWAQLRRAAVGYQMTAGSRGYTAREGRLDLSGRLGSVFGLYGGGSVIEDQVYERVRAAGAGVELNVGDEDRLRVGLHLARGEAKGLPGRQSSKGYELGYLTQIATLHSLGFFYRFTEGDLMPVASVRASQVAMGPAVAPGRRDFKLRDFLVAGGDFEVHEFTVSGSFDLLSAGEDFLFDVSATLVLLSAVGPSVSESASLTIPIGGPLYGFLAGTLEQSSNLGSLQFGSVGVYLLFGGSR